jgi:chromosome segregation ATPase
MRNGYDWLFNRTRLIQDLLEYSESLIRTQKDILSTVRTARFENDKLYQRLTKMIHETASLEKQLEVEFHKCDKELSETTIPFDYFESRFDELRTRISGLKQDLGRSRANK